jgi:hypothetical protein
VRHVERNEHHELFCLQQRSLTVYDGIDIVDTARTYRLTHGTTAAWKSSSNTVANAEYGHDAPHDGCQ